MVFEGCPVPLGTVTNDAVQPCRKFRKIDFRYGKNLGGRIAKKGNIELSAFNEFFHDKGSEPVK